MKKFTKSQRLYLYQFCADMMKAGLPLYDSLVRLQTEGRALMGKSFSDKLQVFLEKMGTEESIAGVFEGFVPQQELGIIFSSEKSGSLAEGLLSIVTIIRFRDSLRSRIVKAVTYPLIMLCLALLVISGYAVKVFPLFATVIPVNTWPAVTQLLYSFGTALAEGLWVILLVAFIVLVFAVRMLLTTVSGNLRNNILDRVIPFTTYKKMSASLFLSSLSSMMRNNIPLNDSLNIILQNANRWMRSHINLMQRNMAMGMEYGRALNTGLLGGGDLLNISLYSSLPSFYDVLESVSELSNKEVEINIERLSGLLKSFSTLILGGCVIWVFIALYALSDTISTMTH